MNKYRQYDNALGNYRVTINFKLFDINAKEVIVVNCDGNGNPFAIAWGKLANRLIDEAEVITEECTCCVTPTHRGGDVEYISDSIEEI